MSPGAVRLRRLLLMVAAAGFVCGTARAADEYTARDLAEAARLVSRVHIAKPELSTLPSDNAQALSEALKGLDPYTQLVPPSRVPLVKEDKTRGRGLGGIFTVTKSGPPIFSPLPGGPAEWAKIDEPLALTRVAGVDVSGKTLADLETIIAGKNEVTVEGQGLRSNGERSATIHTGDFSVEGASVSNVGGVDVIRIDFFIHGETAGRLSSAIDRARLAGRPILIDLRYSPGGDLAEAVASLAALGTGGVGAIVEGNEGKRAELTYSAQSNGKQLPSTYIAVSELTASSAEVFADALVEEGRALLIGETTYGKCLSQRFFDLPDGAGITVSTGRLYRPSGSACETEGIVPDIEMGRDVHDIAAVVKRIKDAGTSRVCATPRGKHDVLPGAESLRGKVWRGTPGGRQCISPALTDEAAKAAETQLREAKAKVTSETLFPVEQATKPKPQAKYEPPADPQPDAKVATEPKGLRSSSMSGGWYFILSLHVTSGAANTAAAAAKSINPHAPVRVETVHLGNLSRHQVVVGPFSDRANAMQACSGGGAPLSSTCGDTGIYFHRDRL